MCPLALEPHPHPAHPTRWSSHPTRWSSRSMSWAPVLRSSLPLAISHTEGNQSWVFIGRTGAEALILWPLDAKNWLMRRDPDAGNDWRQEENGTTGDKMVSITSSMGMSFSKLRELVMDRKAWHAVFYVGPKSWTWLSNWTECIYANAALSICPTLSSPAVSTVCSLHLHFYSCPSGWSVQLF